MMLPFVIANSKIIIMTKFFFLIFYYFIKFNAVSSHTVIIKTRVRVWKILAVTVKVNKLYWTNENAGSSVYIHFSMLCLHCVRCTCQLGEQKEVKWRENTQKCEKKKKKVRQENPDQIRNQNTQINVSVLNWSVQKMKKVV